jgi:hypothetical protein
VRSGVASGEKLRIVVNSRRIATGLTHYETLLPGPFEKMYKITASRTVYERVLDPEQRALIEEARSFASLSGIRLEVIDLGRKNLVSKLLWSITRRFEGPPSVVLLFGGSRALEFLLSQRKGGGGGGLRG